MSHLQIFAAICTMILWGVNFLAVKEVLDYLPPFSALTLRFTAVALILLPLVPIPRGKFSHLLFASFLMGVGHFGLLFWGMGFIDAGLSAVLIQTEIVFFAALGVLFLGERISRYLLIGFLLALTGVLILVMDQHSIEVEFSRASLFGFIGVLAAGLSWAFANVYMKKHLHELPTFTIVGWLAATAVPQVGFLSYQFEVLPFASISAMPLRGWGGLLFVVLGSNLAAYGIWYSLLKSCAVTKLSPFLFLMPIVGLVACVIVRNEPLTVWRIVGAILVFGAMRLCQLHEHRRLPVKGECSV